MREMKLLENEKQNAPGEAKGKEKKECSEVERREDGSEP